MTEQNNKRRVSLINLQVYVYKKLPKSCPFCAGQVIQAKMNTSKGKLVPADLNKCKKCNKRFVTVGFFNKYSDKLISLNPKKTQELVEEREKQKAEKRKRKEENRIRREEQKKNRLVQRLSGKKTVTGTKKISKAERELDRENSRSSRQSILNSIISVYRPIPGFDIDGFKESWMSIDLPSFVFESVFVVVFTVMSNGQVRCFAISSVYSDIEDVCYKTSIIHINSDFAKAILECLKKKTPFFYDGIRKYQVINAATVKAKTLSKLVGSLDFKKMFSYGISRVAPLDAEHLIDYDSKQRVYVYFRLTNTCVIRKHEIETVTAKTTNAKNGEPVEVNVFHCKQCDRYFINYEALQDYIKRGIFPALTYSLVRDIGGSLHEISQLMLYGYNVREGGLSLYERRAVLGWIIDSGLMTKAEIIKDLQFKVRYNGSKSGNERARAKWQDDIQFVSQFVKDNSKTINAVFVRKKKDSLV